MLYLSADGFVPPESSADESHVDVEEGGLALAITDETPLAIRSCRLRALDLYPFCRMPLLLIVESARSQANFPPRPLTWPLSLRHSRMADSHHMHEASRLSDPRSTSCHQDFAQLPELSASLHGLLLPVACIMGPCPNPAENWKQQRRAAQHVQMAGGGAFTLFLHDPLSAFCLLAAVQVISHVGSSLIRVDSLPSKWHSF